MQGYGSLYLLMPYHRDHYFNLNFTTMSRLGSKIAVKKKGDKYLKVIYDKSNDKITVVTVNWTKRP